MADIVNTHLNPHLENAESKQIESGAAIKTFTVIVKKK
jgi:hypothetical protein